MKKKTRLLILIPSIVIGLVLIGLTLWFFARPQAATACQNVTVYDTANYAGKSACLAPGQYTKNNLGVANDSISSIKMPSGFKVTIYDGDNYSGESANLTQSISDLRTLEIDHHINWNDKISSLKIVYTVCPAPLSETRTASCPSGQTGIITETRTKNPVPACTWGDWRQTSNTCATPPPPPPPPRPAPKVNLKANNSQGTITVNYDSTVKLSWSPSNADTCNASGGWSGEKDDGGGNWTSGKLIATTTFTLTCNGNGTASETVIVNVRAKVVTPPVEPPIEEPAPVIVPENTPVENPVVETPPENSVPEETLENPAPEETPPVTPETTAPGQESTNQENSTPANEPGQASSESSSNQESVQTNPETQQKSLMTNVWFWIIIGLVALVFGIYLFIKIKQYSLSGEDLVTDYDSSSEKSVENDITPMEKAPTIESPNAQQPEKSVSPEAHKISPTVTPKPPSNVPMAESSGQNLPDDDMDID